MCLIIIGFVPDAHVKMNQMNNSFKKQENTNQKLVEAFIEGLLVWEKSEEIVDLIEKLIEEKINQNLFSKADE